MNLRTFALKTQRMIRSRGFRGALAWAWQKAWGRFVLDETHIWYELDPASERPRRVLEPGLMLRRGERRDLSTLAELNTTHGEAARSRLERGNDLWLVVDGRDKLLFSCWIFRRRAPAVAAPQGRIELARGMVCLEESVTAPAARGRGVAPAAWCAIADELADEGVRRMITKVTVENLPSRTAVEKVGFEGVALMHFKRIGPKRRTSVKRLDERRGRYFVVALDPGSPDRTPTAARAPRAREEVRR